MIMILYAGLSCLALRLGAGEVVFWLLVMQVGMEVEKCLR